MGFLMAVVSLSTVKTEKWNQARDHADAYYRFLVVSGWGMYRIGEEHGIEPYYPKGKGMLPDGTMAGGIWTEEYMIDQLTQYLYNGGEFVI